MSPPTVRIAPITRAKLEAYCQIHGFADVEALADRLLSASLDDLAHEDLIYYVPPPAIAKDRP